MINTHSMIRFSLQTKQNKLHNCPLFFYRNVSTSLIPFQRTHQQNNIVLCAGKCMIKAQAIILLLMLRKEAISTHNLIPFYFAYDPKCDREAVLISVFPIPGLCMFNSYELDQLFFGTVHSLEFQDCLILSSHTAKYSNPTTDLLSFMIGYAREEQKVFISLKIKL